MKRNYLFFICLCFSLFAAAQSAITLSNTNMPGNGDTLRYTDVQIASLGNYTQTGVNFNWNFSTAVSTTQGLREFKSALQTPYFLFFLNLNEYGEKIADNLGAGPVVINDYYNFYRRQTSPQAFVADGAGITFSSIPVPSYYSDKDELYNFPMSYPKYDSTTFRFSTPNTTIIPVRYSKTGYRVTRVDGWGTVTTPNGTENCLRLVTTQYAMDTVKIAYSGIPITIPPFGYPNFVRSYQWLSTTAKIPVMEITGNLTGNNFVITQARYRGYPQTLATGLGESTAMDNLPLLYPNPAKNSLSLPSTFSGGSYEIYAADGKTLRGAVSSTELDISALPAGIYFLRLQGNEKRGSFKFVKED